MRAAFAAAMTAVWSVLAAWGVMTVPAQAQGPVVVELFTSQGCSKCPPADALLGELASHEDVIALALHVDYWDYIGWPDRFAQAAFTERQQAYARAEGSTVVYTPQMVIHGRTRLVGNEPMGVFSAIMDQAQVMDEVRVDVASEDGAYRVTARLAGSLPEQGMVVQLVSYVPRERVTIGRGENANQTIDYYNIVQSWDVVAVWDGMSTFSASITPEVADLPYVVIVQEAGLGQILGAARLN